MKFYKCSHCGNIIAFVENKGVPVMCCGEKMSEIIPGSVDAAVEKHVPVVEIENGTVKVVVGSVEHPMTEPHYIQWIAIETKKGNQRKVLTPTDKPAACFKICDCDEVVAVYEYCNLHGLWKWEK